MGKQCIRLFFVVYSNQINSIDLNTTETEYSLKISEEIEVENDSKENQLFYVLYHEIEASFPKLRKREKESKQMEQR